MVKNSRNPLSLKKRKRALQATKALGESSDAPEHWSKSKKKRMRRLRAKEQKREEAEPSKNIVEDISDDEQPKKRSKTEQSDTIVSTDAGSLPKSGKSSTLQQSFMARLSGSRFRELNEDLYTTTSADAFTKFSSNPDMYEQYHEGFRHQVEQWPVNPVDVIYKWLVSKFGKAIKGKKVVVADFGCGDAELGKKLIKHNSKNKKYTCSFVVHSFDLVASCDLVTACDMAQVPIGARSVDVAVFCLSLMGTNLADFIREAHRVLKENGKVKIAEVKSRFATDGADNELQEFIETLDKLGFKCVRVDKSNKMFVLLELQQNGKGPDPSVSYTAKPCIYKRR